jgi:hypothetical protein
VDDDAFLGECSREKVETAWVVVQDDDRDIHSKENRYRLQGTAIR